MARIDAHQHFWQFDAARDAWISDDMAVLRRDFLPPDLQALLQHYGFDGCVAVQASQSETETDFLLELATQYDFIKGVVGWVDLRAENLGERLAYYRRFAKLKGFRHILQSEADRALMLGPEFRRGIAALSQHGFTYDLLILPDQLAYATELAAAFPNQAFVLDHLAKPLIKTGEVEPWRRNIQVLAAHQNVVCKVSGLLTEADWHNWQPTDFRPYLDVVFDAFGPNRVLFGSDWPVCEVAGGYSQTVSLLKDYLGSFSRTEQARFWGDNAASFYAL
ncbi:amidohydrolase [Hymenobacter qilianensis]|uniref:Amidohydrolase n=2 Tax=Hymenobacter qilianensis TaxID=1385715 RepID=A0ACB5PRU1_9BACT|nr:amidohydrolase family protein [Hymenobacter qilianensis]QNP52269.1 amidohydrolase family protein [Hymenobacter qilianensis]GGF66028.1 amidohydrolase [Hymenobacter qilianensis]